MSAYLFRAMTRTPPGKKAAKRHAKWVEQCRALCERGEPLTDDERRKHAAAVRAEMERAESRRQ